ncbi:MAG TPA: glutamate synthase central domain-containing protein, partial [Dehalococcoidia bacterium]|nr:glutamate synthase central domain-containing protein [Dehalococcoidia bacterium]
MGENIRTGLYDSTHEHDSCGVGFIVHLKGERSHQIIQDGLTALENLAHRGACGCEENTGDGAGMTLQMPDEFLRHECAEFGLRLPPSGHYGSGVLFTPRYNEGMPLAKNLLASIVAEEGQHLLGWRPVPTNNNGVGATALSGEPRMEQVFIGRAADVPDEESFERILYVIRKRFEQEIESQVGSEGREYYFPSLSCKLLVYKGMLTAPQLRSYYPDLSDPRMVSALAMFHSRFSTNTFPSWRLAHPYRMIAHNGEINTLRGNVNWMNAREALFESPHFESPGKIIPVIDDRGSDTACFDNALELLTLSGRPIEHAVMMLIPEAWQAHTSMSAEKKAFYEYHSSVMEPWDGPASIAFTDGRTIGAVLDRNGLRPSRYYVTEDDLVIMASEVGVLPLKPERVLTKGRLQPGRMFLVNLDEGRIIADDELKSRYTSAHDYGRWIEEHLVDLDDLPPAPNPEPPLDDDLVEQQIVFGYSQEDIKYVIGPMTERAEEAIGSMGNDVPLAVLSDRPQPLYNYFKQLFAQVTNPPLDAIREELVTSVKTLVGGEGNLLDAAPPDDLQILRLETPFLDNAATARVKGQRSGLLMSALLHAH